MQGKQEIREKCLKERKALPAADRWAAAKKVLQCLQKLECMQTAEWILSYSAFRDELSLEELLPWAQERLKHLALPRVDKERKQMEAAEIRSPDDLQIGAYGILEPSPSMQPVPASRLDVVLVPGAAFDRNGARIGYGSGYYDRFLPQLNQNTVTIGIGFHVQMVEEIPQEEHDQTLDAVLTESGLLVVNRKRGLAAEIS